MDLTDVKRHVVAMLDAPLIAVDTETTGIDGIKSGKDYAIGISVAYRLGPLGIFTAYFPLRHETDNLPLQETLDLLKPILRSKPLVFHNRKFDLFSLATLGITDFAEIHYDTLLEAHLIDEELYSKSLDFLGKKYLQEGKDVDKVKDWTKMYGWGSVPPNIMSDYARKDAELTLRLHEVFWKEMSRQELQNLWQTEVDFNTVLYDMERRSVGIDTAFCRDKIVLGEERMANLESILSFDPNKNAELSEFFFEDLGMPVLKRSEKTGKPSLDKHVMVEYDEMLAASDNQTAKLVLQYRGWKTALSMLYRPMLEHEVNGSIYCNFKQHGTATGRLSCERPNLQQIPRKSDKEWNGDARRAFNAGDEDFTLVGYDYSQLELRLAAAYGQEKRLIDEFLKDSADPFTAYMDVIGAPRQDVKTFFYSNIYGAGVAKIAYTMGRPYDEVKDMHSRFVDSIPGIIRAGQQADNFARSRGYVRYWTGRRRHFHYRENTYRAFNSILQGGAAELVKHAQIRMRDIEDDNLQMCLQVHDEIVFKMRRGTEDKYDKLIRDRMTDFPQFGVRFAVESKVWNA